MTPLPHLWGVLYAGRPEDQDGNPMTPRKLQGPRKKKWPAICRIPGCTNPKRECYATCKDHDSREKEFSQV